MKAQWSKLKAQKKFQASNSKMACQAARSRFGTWNLVLLLSFELLVLSFATRAADDPSAELASFTLAPGFEVNLFASEADGVVKPIQCRWDARGRLWVIGSTVYPQLQPGEVPDDKILILEDTHHDGRADKTTVFARGLMIPTGIELDGDAGGCYLGEGTQLLHLRDTDGDGVADEKTVVLRGFGTGDNHQNINSFRWSPGGELYFCQGLHARARVETPFGIVALDEAGFWRLRPRQLRLDSFYGGPAEPQNPWGVIFTDWGQPLINAGNNGGVSYPAPEMIRGHSIGGRENIWVNARGRKTSGPDIVANSHWPAEWQGALILGGYINNAVWALKIEDDGAGFRVSDLPPLITSTHTSFRPVDVKFGPDGALYIADWYNPIIGHYQASFRHPDRDKKHGRIWRVTAKGRSLVKPPKLVGAPLASVLEQLKSPERWNIEQARRVLAAADSKAVTEALKSWIAKLNPKDIRFEHHLFEALAVYECHEVVETALLKRLLTAKEPNARAYAAAVIARWADRIDQPLDLLVPLVGDGHPRARLAAIVAAANIPGARSVDLALQAVEQPVDTFIALAIKQAVLAQKAHWLPALTAGTLDAARHPDRLEFLVKADGTPDTLRALRELVSSTPVAGANREALLLTLAEAGDSTDHSLLLMTNTFHTSSGYDVKQHARVLSRLAEAVQVRKTAPPMAAGEAMASVAAVNDRDLQIAALRLVGHWKMDRSPLVPVIIAFCTVDDDELRNAAAWSLAVVKGEAARPELGNLASTNRIVGEQLAAAIGFAQFDSARAAEIAGRLLARDLSEARIKMLFGALLQRRDGSSALARAFAIQKPARDTARLVLRHLQAIGRQDKELVAALTEAAGLGGEPLRGTPEFVNQLVAESRTQGDTRRGAEVFRRADLNCTTCHAIGSQGGSIGPALDTLGSGQPLDFIIGAVLEPNKEVKESYEAIEVTTKDGATYQGYRLRADNRELVLRDVALNKEVRLRRDQIAEQRDRGSLMPPGLVDHLTRQELCDLFRFLGELGKSQR
jgi:putative heme-binding domain-containing protein